MEKQRTITADDLVIGDKEIYDAVMAAIEYTDKRPKLGVLKLKRYSSYKKYTSNMAEKKVLPLVLEKKWFKKIVSGEKSDLPSDIIKVKVGKDGAPSMPPKTLTVKIDYSDSVCTADHYNATKLASSVLPVSSISPFRVEMCKKRLPFMVPVIFKLNTYNIGQLGIPSPDAFLSNVPDDSIAGPKNI